ncbi:hypothetical protein ACFTUC_34570, partial [Streptomyces sp. NPDC056944]
MSSHARRSLRPRSPRLLGAVAGAALLLGGGFAAQAFADSGPKPVPAAPTAPDAAPAAPKPVAAPQPATAPKVVTAPKPVARPAAPEAGTP